MNYALAKMLPGQLAFDTSANLLTMYSLPQLQALFLAMQRPGYKPCALRYVGLSKTSVGPYDLTPAEVERLATVGFGVMGLQERFSGWSAATGTQDGEAAALNAIKCGLLPGSSFWVAAEIFDYATCVAYLNAWWTAALKVIPTWEASLGVYVGSNALNAVQWQNDVPFHRYWKSGANVPTPSTRGYQIFQLWPGTQIVGGVPIDWDPIAQDYRGDLPIMQAAA